MAEKLSIKLGIPHHSTDDYYYEIKWSKPRDRQKSIEEISMLYHEDKWIVEGTTIHLLRSGLESADMIIYLAYKNIFYQWLVLLKRHFSKKEETFSGSLRLMRHVFYKRYGLGHKKGKMTHAEFIAPYKDKVITLSSFKEIENFINTI